MLEVSGLGKKFKDRRVVNNVRFQVEKGESYGLLGPNGAGKTTLISMVSGLLHPSEGDAIVGGASILHDRKKAQRKIGIVPQDIALYLDFSAQENLTFWGKMYKLKGNELRKRVDEVLEVIGLSERRKDRVSTFSGGMKRRLNIGCALLHQPELLIMDEPTVGIDPQSRNHILETVKQLNREGMTVIYTSHYMEEVQSLCNRVGIFDQGECIAEGNVDKISTMFGALSEIHIEIEDGRAEDLATALAAYSEKEPMQQDGQWVLFHRNPEKVLSDVIELLKNKGCRLLGIDIREPNLESVFLQLTGRTLRD